MIGLFDSGIGGLTVLASLKKAMPHESFIYLGDTARLPYGTKSPETIQRYTKQNIRFLKNQGVDTVVSACHSASSSILIYDIKDDIPLYNVIAPSCEEAMLKSKSRKIGLLATQATVDGGQYHKLIPKPYELYAQASPLLVPLVECGWIEDAITESVIARYVQPLLDKNVDVIILGCTHFPLLKKTIQKIAGPGVTLVDPGDSLADLLKKSSTAKPPTSLLHIFLTDQSPHFVRLAQNLLNDRSLKITQVDLAPLS
jgi:glutamate racemase